MLPFNDRIPIIVQTHRGNIPIDNVYPGDRVYNYITGKEEEVLDIFTYDKEDVYKISYTDRREDYYRGSELIYTGDSLTTVGDIININPKLNEYRGDDFKIFYGDLKQYPIYYDHNTIKDPVFPDAYISGALLINGDRSDKYINLPNNTIQANYLFSYKYQLDYAEKLSDDKVYFKYDGKSKNEYITWDEFFPTIDWNIHPPIIPLKYLKGSINERCQFIRGIFDTAFDQDIFPDTCTIVNKHEEKLKAVQEMLWGMGILSTVTFDPNMFGSRNKNYRLDVVSDLENYPGLFYHIESIEAMMEHRKRLRIRKPVFKLQIKSIQKNTTLLSKGYSYNLVLRNRNTLYTTSNFLPRVSL